MANRKQWIYLALTAWLATASCVHQAGGPRELVPAVDGTITIQSYDGHELMLQGQSLYLVPATRETKEFFEAHGNDFYVEATMLLGLPGAKSAVIDRFGKFAFSNVAQGDYFVYWQLPRPDAPGARRHVSIDNKVIKTSISPRNNTIVFESTP